MNQTTTSDAMAHYETANVGGKQVKNLTPLDVVSALLVEYEIMQSDKSPFCQQVAKALREIPIKRQDGTIITLDIIQLWCEFYNLFEAYGDTEFAIATFGSMYSTRVDRETMTFDPNFHISGKEAFSVSDDTAFTKMVKMWYFLMSEMFYRFFYTYDFRTINTERAYYTVLGDSSKKKRSTSKFCEFLLAFRPLYAELCMLSPDKKEIYSIFTDAASNARHLRELKMKRFEHSGKHHGTKAYVAKTHESHVERITRLNKRLKEMDIIMKRIPAFEAQIDSATQSQNGTTPPRTPTPPKSVWKVNVPVPVPVPVPVKEVEIEDDGFTTVTKIRKPPHQTPTHQTPTHQTRPTPKQASRSHRAANIS